MKQRHLFAVCLATGLMSVFAVISGCGREVDFAGVSGVSRPAEHHGEDSHPATPTPTAVPDVEGDMNLTWFWQCPTKPVSLPQPADSHTLVVEGGTQVPVSTVGVRNFTVTPKGNFCDTSGPRDILFVVDVSDSMRSLFNFGNDPVSNGTCGRVDAVKAVLATVDSASRVSFVTFDGDIVQVAPSWMTADAFMTNYANVDVLCHKGANTNYTKAFTKAQEVIATGRRDAHAELYFLSDGGPQDTGAGRDEAASIKETATIATLLLQGNDAIMEELASKDAAGKPLYARVDNAGQLAGALALLSKVWPVIARWSWIVNGSHTGEQTMPITSGLSFQGAPLTIDPADHPAGLGFQYETMDNRGVRVVSGGSLVWN